MALETVCAPPTRPYQSLIKSVTVSLLWKYRYYILRVIIGILPSKIYARFSLSMPQVTSFFTALHSNDDATDNTLPIGAAGYCWGAKHVVNLAHGQTTENGKRPLIDAAYVAHPSHLDIPTEIEKVKQPISVAIGDNDMALKMPGVNQLKEILSKKGDVESEVTIYPGARHGFAVRSNPGDEKEKRQGEEAREQAVHWFKMQFGKVKR